MSSPPTFQPLLDSLSALSKEGQISGVKIDGLKISCTMQQLPQIRGFVLCSGQSGHFSVDVVNENTIQFKMAENEFLVDAAQVDFPEVWATFFKAYLAHFAATGTGAAAR